MEVRMSLNGISILQELLDKAEARAADLERENYFLIKQMEVNGQLIEQIKRILEI
jgi:hypothetical protein